MRTKWFWIILVSAWSLAASAQDVLSAYKYIVVPTKFEGFKRQNQYQTSTLIKYLLVERGFNAVYEDALPAELFNDKCLGLKAILVDESGTFTTKAHIVFQDCQLKEVYRTMTGSSKIKDYKGAFQEAIREALKSLNNFTYAYSPGKGEDTVALDFSKDVKTMAQEVESTTKDTEVSGAMEKAASPLPAAIEISGTPEASKPSSPPADEGTWYAQEIPNGFQLVDRTPKVRLKLFHSGKSGIFLAAGAATNGVVYQMGETWFFDYYQDGKLVHKALKIKF